MYWSGLLVKSMRREADDIVIWRTFMCYVVRDSGTTDHLAKLPTRIWWMLLLSLDAIWYRNFRTFVLDVMSAIVSTLRTNEQLWMIQIIIILSGSTLMSCENFFRFGYCKIPGEQKWNSELQYFYHLADVYCMQLLFPSAVILIIAIREPIWDWESRISNMLQLNTRWNYLSLVIILISGVTCAQQCAASGCGQEQEGTISFISRGTTWRPWPTLFQTSVCLNPWHGGYLNRRNLFHGSSSFMPIFVAKHQARETGVLGE